jgi:hypothetical protein
MPEWIRQRARLLKRRQPARKPAGARVTTLTWSDRSVGASAPASPEDRITAWPYEKTQNDQDNAEDDRAGKEHHDPGDDKNYGDDP